jgi:Cu2+-exporting ATPase
MSLSVFCRVSNALRLNLFKPKLTAEHTLPSAAAITENHENPKGTVDSMKTTLEIKGMMCPHCEAHMRKALEGMEGVTVLAVLNAMRTLRA